MNIWANLMTQLKNTANPGELLVQINGKCHRVTGSAVAENAGRGTDNIVLFAEPEVREESQTPLDPPPAAPIEETPGGDLNWLRRVATKIDGLEQHITAEADRVINQFPKKPGRPPAKKPEETAKD